MKKYVDEDAAYFVANQVENIPTQGQATLFVIGLRSLNEIKHYISETNGIKNIHMGTLGSFYKKTGWNEALTYLLDMNLNVSLEYPPDAHSFLLGQLDEDIWSNRKFTAVICCRIPKSSNLNQNTVIKIDDESFNSTNEGVYCVPLKEVMDSNRFTSWHDYGEAKTLVTKTDLKLKRFGNKRK